MRKDPKKYLYDILEAIDYIFEDHLAEVESFEVYNADRTVQKAVERELITIGEAVNMLRQQGVHLENGDQVINRRNMLAHRYDSYTPEAIWRSVHNELPGLRVDVEHKLGED